jgi:hypothetical protein
VDECVPDAPVGVAEKWPWLPILLQPFEQLLAKGRSAVTFVVEVQLDLAVPGSDKGGQTAAGDEDGIGRPG